MKLQKYLDIVRRAGYPLGHCFDCSGRSEGLLNDKGSTAAYTVLCNHSEVVRRVLLETSDLDGGG